MLGREDDNEISNNRATAATTRRDRQSQADQSTLQGQITQIEVFPLNDSYVPYCITFKTSEGTLTMNADRRMLRELYHVLREEFRPIPKGANRCRELV